MRSMFTLLLLIYPRVYGQEISFFQEDITFTLDRNSFKVDGFYWFANQSDKPCEKAIYYPFCNGSEKEQIDSTEVIDVSRNSISQIENEDKEGFRFLLRIAARDTGVYRVKYSQNIAGDSAAYKLVSTQQWNKALDCAEYKLIVEKQFELTRFSYEPDTVYDIGDRKIYYWKKSRFMPQSDMVFHFKRE